MILYNVSCPRPDTRFSGAVQNLTQDSTGAVQNLTQDSTHWDSSTEPVCTAMELENATQFRFQEEQKTLLTQYWEKGMQCCSKSVSALIEECAIAAKCSVEHVKVRQRESRVWGPGSTGLYGTRCSPNVETP